MRHLCFATCRDERADKEAALRWQTYKTHPPHVGASGEREGNCEATRRDESLSRIGTCFSACGASTPSTSDVVHLRQMWLPLPTVRWNDHIDPGKRIKVFRHVLGGTPQEFREKRHTVLGSLRQIATATAVAQ